MNIEVNASNIHHFLNEGSMKQLNATYTRRAITILANRLPVALLDARKLVRELVLYGEAESLDELLALLRDKFEEELKTMNQKDRQEYAYHLKLASRRGNGCIVSLYHWVVYGEIRGSDELKSAAKPPTTKRLPRYQWLNPDETIVNHLDRD